MEKRTRKRPLRGQEALAQPATVTVTAPLSDQNMVAAFNLCCIPVTIGHFKNGALVALYKRHVGRRCAPGLDPLDVKAWRKERGLR